MSVRDRMTMNNTSGWILLRKPLLRHNFRSI